jgi:prepilin-type processing-associated H-X9-DG protein
MRRIINVGVLVFVLFLATGLLLVFVQKAREAGIRAQCQNNLNALGLGMKNYPDVLNRLPPGTVPNQALPPEKRLSWLVDNFDFFAGMALRIDRQKGWEAPENQEPKGQGMIGGPRVLGNLSLFLCPANPSRAPDGQPGLTHYVGIAGIGPDAASRPLHIDDKRTIDPTIGYFGYDRILHREDIKDGLSTTMMVLETRLNNGPWTAGGYPTLRGLDPAAQPYIGTDGQFGGTHSGGVNALFADWSVRFLSQSIDPRVFEGLATIAGGEDVGNADSW